MWRVQLQILQMLPLFIHFDLHEVHAIRRYGFGVFRVNFYFLAILFVQSFDFWTMIIYFDRWLEVLILIIITFIWKWIWIWIRNRTRGFLVKLVNLLILMLFYFFLNQIWVILIRVFHNLDILSILVKLLRNTDDSTLDTLLFQSLIPIILVYKSILKFHIEGEVFLADWWVKGICASHPVVHDGVVGFFLLLNIIHKHRRIIPIHRIKLPQMWHYTQLHVVA